MNDITAGYSTSSDVVLSSFSSTGPTDDGRIKPDIVANGVSLISAYDDLSSATNLYASSSGTSMSAPSATGSLTLLQQHYFATHGDTILAATLKALVIHTADEAGTNDGPDYQFGWGLLNTASAAQAISDAQTIPNILRETSLAAGTGGTFSYGVSSLGTGPIQVTIVWNDSVGTPPGAVLDDTTHMLVNDLDLRITKDSDATVYYPWKLDVANPSNAATTGDNLVDNVEQVYIASPASGSYTVTVSHKGTLAAVQNFSIITTADDYATAPAAPTGLVAAAGSQQVDLHWNPNSETDVAKYYIYGGTSTAPTALVDSTTFGANDTTIAITGLTNGTPYFYRVTAVDDSSNESGYSNEVVAVPFSAGGNMLSLDGINDYMTIPDNALWTSGSNDFTIELWVNHAELDRDVGLGQDGAEGQWQILWHDGNDYHLRYYYEEAGAAALVNLISPDTFMVNIWYHVAVVRDGNWWYLYQDGELVASDSVNATMLDITSTMNLGATNATPGNFFKGGFDELRIWNVASTGAQVQANMTTPVAADASGLVAYWRMDESSGATAYDATTAGNHGTLVNGTAQVASTAPLNGEDFFAPAAPTGLVADADYQAVTLTWSANSESDLAKYYIYADSSTAPTTLVDSATATTATVDGLINGTAYYFRVTAVDDSSNEGGFSSEVTGTPVAPTDKSGNVSGETWAAGTYIVTGDLTVDASTTLTLSPGVIVKLGANRVITVNGTIIAEGTATDSIVFTSIKDDAYGGDTNGDGTATSPAAGDWLAVQLNSASTGSRFKYLNVRYGGNWAGQFSQGAMIILGGSPTISNSWFYRNNKGIQFGGASAATLQSSLFEETSKSPISIGFGTDITFSGNTYLNNSINGLGIYAETYSGTDTLAVYSVAGYTNIPYVIQDDLTIGSDGILTLTPGVVLKFNTRNKITVNGTLIAEGTASDSIVFTSLKNDSYGGDTNNDGTGSTPAAGDWHTIIVNASSDSSSSFDYTVFSYGGEWLGQQFGAIRALGGSPTIKRSRFYQNKKALYFSSGSTSRIDTVTIVGNDYGISIEGAAPIIHQSTLHDNTTYDVENLGTDAIDAWNNYWGLTTYAEMIAGPYPQNITSIFDYQDDNSKGVVDYSNWIEPFNYAPAIISADAQTATEDTYFIYRATATDPEDSTITWIFDLAPVWLSSAADSIFGTPAGTDADTSFRVIAFDGDKADTLVVTVTIVPVNDPPVITTSTGITVVEGGETAITQSQLQATDPDDPPSQLTYQVLLPGATLSGDFLLSGSVVSSFTQADIDNGWLSFKHDGSENLLDSAGFAVADTAGLADTVETFYITVTAVNDLPRITSTDSLNLEEGTQLVYRASHVDPDGPVTVWTFTDYPVWMTWNAGADSITLSPVNGSVDTSFLVIVSDTLSADTLKVTVIVRPWNDAPIAVDDTVSTDEDVPVTIAAVVNDFDIDNDHSILVISGIDSPPLHGNVDILGDTALYYTPKAEFSGSDSLRYIVSDGLKSDTAKVVISVIYVNDPPIITSSADTLVMEEGAVFIYFATHTDPDGPDTVWTFSDYPGWMTWNFGADSLILATGGNTADASFKVKVFDGENGDSITVSVVVVPFNDAPVAVNDTVQTDEDLVVTLEVLRNDTDVDNAFLSVDSLLTLPFHGVAVIDAGDTTISYTPVADYFGNDSLTYIISDGMKHDTATVFITIAPVNDRPSIISLASVSMDEGAEWTYQALVDDIDGPDTLWTYFDYPGWFTWIVGSSSITATPGEGDADTTFKVTVTDGFLADTMVVAVSVTPVNDAPLAVDDTLGGAEDDTLVLAVLDNDSDPENAALKVAAVTGQPAHGSTELSADSLSILYVPAQHYNGSDTLSYSMTDGTLLDTALVFITVTPVNDAPVAMADTVTTPEDTELTIFALTNDTDIDGDSLTIVGITQPTHGAAKIDSGATTLTYTPSADFWGTDSLTYAISDGSGGFDTATALITVTSVNDAPQPFTLLTPKADSLLVVTAAMIGDSVQFVWGSAFDPDGDTVKYFFLLTRGGAVGDTAEPAMTLDTSIYVQIDSMMIAQAIESGVTEIVHLWDVLADDGEASTLSTDFNRMFTLKFADELLALGDRLGVPTAFALHQNYPNPFNPTSTIRFDLPEMVALELVIYDLRGRTIVRLSHGRLPAGYHQVIWNGRDRFGKNMPSGIYIARLVTPEYTKSIKMVLLK
ncbi:MAG: tandem-95 repeat protein [Candidatus Marinimicrobia bacterium]|nr:tandem-95 repeat protein [Candidatus Neomarinimicrobiota bacterium]